MRGKKLTTKEFINKSNLKHNNLYDYSLVNYINNRIKVKIICNLHGIFEQNPNSHLSGSGCIQCFNKRKLHNTEKFIDVSTKIHRDRYDYSLVKYIKNTTKVKIICSIHGIFEQTPYGHKNGQGCPSCSGLKKYNNNEFILKANEVHKNKYDYSLIDYINTHTKININCNIHGIFKQTPHKHISQKQGCPKCMNKSKGELLIIEYLTVNNILYEYQKMFIDCKDINTLKFDFYIPSINTCIEYNGIQHYKSIKYFGGEYALLSNIKRDNIKKEYCNINDIKLIIFKYNQTEEEVIGIIKNLLLGNTFII